MSCVLSGEDLEASQKPGTDSVNHAGDQLEEGARFGCLLAVQ